MSELFDPFVLLACAVGALFVGFIIMALILEHLCYRLRQFGDETRRIRHIERKRKTLRNKSHKDIKDIRQTRV